MSAAIDMADRPVDWARREAGLVPPSDTEAERVVLAMCLLDSAALGRIGELRAEHMATAQHRAILAAILELDALAEPTDVVTVRHRLEATGRLAIAGGAHYLGELTDCSPSGAATLETHAARVVQLATLRRTIDCCREEAVRGYGAADDVPGYLGRVEARLGALAWQQSASVSCRPLATAVADLHRELAAGPDARAVYPTGLVELDRRLSGGLRPGEQWVIAARPGAGKSALAGTVALSLADSGHGVLLLSLEMGADQVALRLAAARSGVDVWRLRSRDLGPEDWRRLTAASDELSRMPITICDDASATVSTVRRHVRRLAATEHPVRVVVVDYLQLLAPEGLSRGSSREVEVASMSRALKRLALEQRIACVVLSQLNRGVESRADKRPMLSDLRESGAIEQDADGVLMLYRADHYRPVDQRDGLAELAIAKHRNGPTGTVNLRFLDACTRFEGVESHQWERGEEPWPC